MAGLSHRNQNRADIWPGFVDALATLLMVIMFLLMIFVLAQFFLREALSGRDQALENLRNQASELSDLLGLEQSANETLRKNIATLSDELSASLTLRDDFKQEMQSLTLRAETAENQANTIKSNLANTIEVSATNQKKQTSQIISLNRDIEKLKALRDQLEEKTRASLAKLANANEVIITEKKLSNSARAEVALLNKQLGALHQQITQISKLLGASELDANKQRVKIASLGKRLNTALASKVQELSNYRSEFFGKLRALLGNQPGIRIVGDRFVFQSEVLFTTGSDQLGAEGKDQIKKLAGTLNDISKKIPPEIAWVLRVDGHTDTMPIKTSRFPSNWELSTARAISVVKSLVSQGILPSNLAATGFGEFQPIDLNKNELANRRNRRIELKLTQR